MKRALITALVLLLGISAFAQGPFPMFNNRTHTADAQPFADLSRQIWDLMAAKDADALKDIFHPNAMFVHMGGYWDFIRYPDFYPRGWKMQNMNH